MATNNAINAPLPFSVPNGGIGTTTLTDHGILLGDGTSAITTVSVGSTGELLVGVTSSAPVFSTSSDGNFTFTSATASANRILTVSNTDNTAAASSSAQTILSVGGASAGDPALKFSVTGVTNWALGIDNSDSDAFVISASSTLGSLNVMHINTSDVINYPLTSSFAAYNNTLRSNVTGNSTTYSPIPYDAEHYDVGSDYDGAGTFTAPKDGVYVFSVGGRNDGYNGTQDESRFQRLSSTANGWVPYQLWTGPDSYNLANPSNQLGFSHTSVIYMDEGDDQDCVTTVFDGSLTIDIAASEQNFFAGTLIA